MRKPVMPYANNKGTDQPAHPLSLIDAQADQRLCCSLVAVTWSQIPKTGFLVTRLSCISLYRLDEVARMHQQLTIAHTDLTEK